MTNNFYEEYFIHSIINKQLESLFKTFNISDPVDKFQHVELICNKILEEANFENLEELTEIINRYVKEKQQEYLQDGSQQAG